MLDVLSISLPEISCPQVPMGLQFPEALTGHFIYSCFELPPAWYLKYAIIPISALSQARQKPVLRQARMLQANSTLSSVLREGPAIGWHPPGHSVLPWGANRVRASKNAMKCPIVLSVAFFWLDIHLLQFLNLFLGFSQNHFSAYVVVHLVFLWENKGLESVILLTSPLLISNS